MHAEFEFEMELNGIQEELKEIPIVSYDDFEDAHSSEFGVEEEFQYDPVSRKYLNRTSPVLKCNQAYDEKDIIKAYLEQNGLPCDDEEDDE